MWTLHSFPSETPLFLLAPLAVLGMSTPGEAEDPQNELLFWLPQQPKIPWHLVGFSLTWKSHNFPCAFSWFSKPLLTLLPVRRLPETIVLLGLSLPRSNPKKLEERNW